MNKINLENKCGYNSIAKEMKDKNIYKNIDPEDCIACGGYDFDCKNYFNPLEEYNKAYKKSSEMETNKEYWEMVNYVKEEWQK